LVVLALQARRPVEVDHWCRPGIGIGAPLIAIKNYPQVAAIDCTTRESAFFGAILQTLAVRPAQLLRIPTSTSRRQFRCQPTRRSPGGAIIDGEVVDVTLTCEPLMLQICAWPPSSHSSWLCPVPAKSPTPCRVHSGPSWPKGVTI